MAVALSDPMLTCPACQTENEASAGSCVSCGRALGLAPGSVVAGRYEILALLGQGGMGMVFKARDRQLDEVIALKVLRSDTTITPELSRRFRAEIKMARRVTHKNVCRIHEYGQDGDLQYISMAFVDGVDLKQVLRRQGGLTTQEAFDVAIAVAEALQAVHEEGIVHRDLKTANIMRDARGVVRLMDFGIAKQTEEGSPGLTATGMIVGTPEYMSPEQCRGEKVDVRSDVYSLGVVVYELFTGRVPFRGETAIATIIKHLQEPPPLDSPEAAPLPGPVVRVLAKALAKNPADRYATAHDVAEALSEARAVDSLGDPFRGAVRGGATESAPPTASLTPGAALRRGDRADLRASTAGRRASTRRRPRALPPGCRARTRAARTAGDAPDRGWRSPWERWRCWG